MSNFELEKLQPSQSNEGFHLTAAISALLPRRSCGTVPHWDEQPSLFHANTSADCRGILCCLFLKGVTRDDSVTLSLICARCKTAWVPMTNLLSSCGRK